MSESRVERLLRLAEAAAVSGDLEQTEALLAVLGRALYIRQIEIKQLNKQWAKEAVDVEHE